MIQTQFYAQVIRSNKGGEHFNENLENVLHKMVLFTNLVVLEHLYKTKW